MAERPGQHPATRAMLLREGLASARMDRDQTINLGAPVTNYAVAPGEYIAEWLQEEEVSHAELEYALGVPETYLDALLSGQIALSDDVARALERLTGIPVTSWQRLDAKYWQDKARLAAESPWSRHLRDYMAQHDLSVERLAAAMGQDVSEALRAPDTDLLNTVARLTGTDVRSLVAHLSQLVGDGK